MTRIFASAAILLIVSLACVSPAWVPTTTPTPVITPSMTKTPVMETVMDTPGVPVKVTAYQSLHVRVRPGEHAGVLGYLYSHDEVTLTGRCSAGWAQIEFKDRKAWVNSRYLSENKCQAK